MGVNIPGNGRVSITGKMKIGPTFSPITATGGTINDVTVNNVTYRTHTFTSTGILTVTSAENNIATVEYLVVGGGAGGGSGRHITGPTGRSGGGGGVERMSSGGNGSSSWGSGNYSILLTLLNSWIRDIRHLDSVKPEILEGSIDHKIMLCARWEHVCRISFLFCIVSAIIVRFVLFISYISFHL